MRCYNHGYNSFKTGPPNVQPVQMPLNPELREAVNQVRRQKRKIQRTRAAERELYRAAEDEKNADTNAPEAKKQKFDYIGRALGNGKYPPSGYT